MNKTTTAKARSATAMPERSYEWFNSLLGRTEPVTPDELREMWSDDCVMITNGQVKCAGIAAFVKHFNEIRSKLKSWQVALPLAIRVEQGNTVGAYYHVDIVSADGSTGRVLVTAFFDIVDGKASKMTEVAHFEGMQLKLENH
jgi:hypothetical protein